MSATLSRRCESCGPRTGKYAQEKSGLCRACHRREENSVGIIEREARRREQGKIAHAQRMIPKPPGGPRRVVRADGKEFEVLWDGT